MSDFGVFLLMFTGLLLLVGLIQVLAAWDRFYHEGGLQSTLDRLAYVNRDPPMWYQETHYYPPAEQFPSPVPAHQDAVPRDSSDGTSSEPAEPVSRHMSDIMIVAFLASLKKADESDRFSGNEIVALMGVRREETLSQIRQVRAGKKKTPPEPVFPEMTPEQAAFREQLITD